jgi:hypothetical protein
MAAALLASGVVEAHRRLVVGTGGPVSSGGAGTGQPIEVGTPYSLAHTLWNDGKKPAVVERVKVFGVDGPVEVLDVWARQHPSGPRHDLFFAAFGAPPADFPSKPLAEEHVVPVRRTDEGLQIVVGVKPTGPGIARIGGIEVTYRVGHRRYREVSDAHGFLCAPAADYMGMSAPGCGGHDEEAWDGRSVEFRVPGGDGN